MMSQSAASNKSSLPRPSGLPRPSRLPISRSTFDAPPIPKIPATYQVSTLRSKACSSSNTQPNRSGSVNEAADSKEATDRGFPQGSSTARYQSGAADENGGPVEEVQKESARDDTARRRPRPSLSDRTIETLSHIPPSPSPHQRKSSFFPSESPERNIARPGSSLSRPRPSTSHGPPPNISSTPSRSTSPVKRSAKRAPSTNVTPSKTTTSKRAVSSYTPRSVPYNNAKTRPEFGGTPSQAARPPASSALHSGVADTISKPPLKIATGSKTFTARSSKPRPAVADTFKKPNLPDKTVGIRKDRLEGDFSNRSVDSTASSMFSPASRKSSQTSQASNDPVATPAHESAPHPKLASSAALRETIAKAKAAHRKAAEAGSKAPQKVQVSEDDMFPAASNKRLLRKRIEMARTEGRLNLAALGLTEIPSEVKSMYDLNTSGASGAAWYESVDVTRLIAADNKIDSLGEEFFPDTSAEDLQNADDETKGTLFGALESVDLHGNFLVALPPGLRQLNYLTVLNLSKNKLTNECLATIAQVESLLELRLADNELRGSLPRNLGQLNKLQVLDLHNNSITDVPEILQNLINLRKLNLADNQLRSAPMESLSLLPIVELDLSRNRISGSLIPGGLQGFNSLQVLDVSGNALTSLTGDGAITFPKLQSLAVSENRLQSFPDIASCTALTNLAAANNALVSLPEGMAALRNLRNLDLMGNNIKKLDEGIIKMVNLTILNIANNPLRERRFLTMNTEDLKRELQNRLLPPEPVQGPQNDDSQDIISSEAPAQPKTWRVKPGGILDRSFSSLSTVEAADLEPLLTSTIRSVNLSHNSLCVIPSSISLLSSTLTTLEISHNKLTGSNYLSSGVSLPNLRDLNLASNTITSLDPLLSNLSAPRLEALNVSYNRLVALPCLRNHFPALATAQASDNQIIDLLVDSVRGLQVCNVARNDIAHLEAQLGLLEADGLRTLVVEGNRFRVPRREVVEGGTEKLLAWLKGRIPGSG